LNTFIHCFNKCEYAFLIFKGSTSSSGTGPTEAFAGLYYKYTEASSPRVQGDYAILDTSNYILAGNVNKNKNDLYVLWHE